MRRQSEFYDTRGEVVLQSERVPFEETGISAYSEAQAKVVALKRLQKKERFQRFLLTPALLRFEFVRRHTPSH